MNASAIKRIALLFALSLLSFQYTISMAAPVDSSRYGYEDAKSLYGTNKRLQDLIDARNERIRRNQDALERLRRESRTNGVDAVLNNADIRALERAIENDRRDVRLYEHRQGVVARNWDKSNLRNYYGSLQETSRRSIYDPKTKRERNLMDYRIDAFRNPGVRRSQPGPAAEHRVSRSNRDIRHTGSDYRSHQAQNSQRLSQPTSNSRSTPRSNPPANSNRTTRSTHTITLTPTK